MYPAVWGKRGRVITGTDLWGLGVGGLIMGIGLCGVEGSYCR